MPAKINIIHMRRKAPDGAVIINTCSNAKTGWQRDLSPFLLGPCPVYNGYVAQNVENLWQFHKLYKMHADIDGNPTAAYWDWAEAGWSSTWAYRYPMGRGAAPLCGLWEGRKLNYIESRKEVYGPSYARTVQRTKGWKKLKDIYDKEDEIWLRDWDGRETDQNMSEVLNDPKRKMGHAFVLKMLLTQDSALDEFVW